MDYFCGRGAPDKRDFRENFANYKFNSPIENDITEKRKVRMVELIFLLVFRNVVFFFMQHLRISVALGTREKNVRQFS